MLDVDHSTSTANLAGNVTYQLTSSLNSYLWIIDSGASDHMTPSLSSLQNPTPTPHSRPIWLPNGNTLPTTHQGTTPLSPHISLSKVLHVPSFSFNLLFVSKITHSVNCDVTFFPSFCVFQDLSTRRLIGVGEMCDGLYYFHPSSNNPTTFPATRGSSSQLWHQHLGHPSNHHLSTIIFAFSPNLPNMDLYCDT